MRKHDSIRGAENQFQEITQIKTEKNKVGEGNIDIPHPPTPAPHPPCGTQAQGTFQGLHSRSRWAAGAVVSAVACGTGSGP